MDYVAIWEVGRDVIAALAVLSAGAGGVWAYRKRGRAVAEGVVADEWSELAKVRGKTIEDMDKRIQQLESRIAHLEGAYAALQGLKSTEIADEVVSRLVGRHEVDV